MGIYVDEIFYWPGQVAKMAQRHGKKWCHLWCDKGEEESLHKFAQKIGLKHRWFQRNRVIDHYDLTPGKRELAIQAGAIPKSIAKWLTERDQTPQGVGYISDKE